MPFNCIAIDDDINALEILTDYISHLPNYKLVKCFTDPTKALESIRSTNNIDILFIDIEMLSMSGIELSKVIMHRTKRLVFTATHPQCAIDAYHTGVDGFLLKPYSFSKFNVILNKLFLDNNKENKQLAKMDDFFFVKSKGEKNRIVKVKYDDIIAIESMQNYVSFYTLNKTIVSYLTITKVKEILNHQQAIIQVHRSFLISLRYIEEIETNMIKMYGNLKITLGDKYKDILLSYIKDRTVKN